MTRTLIATLLCLVSFASCKLPYTPSADRPFEEIPEFSLSTSVALVNGQPDASEQRIGHRWVADYNAWTDVAIQIAERELTNRGLGVRPEAEPRLVMKITSAEYATGWVKITTTIQMSVEAGNGYVGEYTGVNSSVMAAAPKRQMDGAMMRVVADMLRDDNIIEYLRSAQQRPGELSRESEIP